MRGLLAMTAVLGALFAAVGSSQAPITRTLGKPQAEFAEPFTEIGAIRELRDGRLIVVDARELTVKLVDLRSGNASPIGRTGDGPGEYRWPGKLFALSDDKTLLQDNTGGRLTIIGPDGKPGDVFDPNRSEGDSIRMRAFRFHVRASDARGMLYGEAQPIRVGANGALELADNTAIERLNVTTLHRDTVALRPVRKDANARLYNGMVMTQPRMQAFPAWDQWSVAPDGRVAFVYSDPYHVNFVGANRQVVENPPIPYDRIRVDDALKKQWKEDLERPRMAMMYSRGGGSSMQMMPGMYSEPKEWPEYLPPYHGSPVFASNGLLWIPRGTAAGKLPLYDVIDGKGKLVERVELPARTKLVGFGSNSVYVVRLDEDDLQYLQRHPLPTTARP
jgi:hypothetical protein